MERLLLFGQANKGVRWARTNGWFGWLARWTAGWIHSEQGKTEEWRIATGTGLGLGGQLADERQLGRVERKRLGYGRGLCPRSKMSDFCLHSRSDILYS